MDKQLLYQCPGLPLEGRKKTLRVGLMLNNIEPTFICWNTVSGIIENRVEYRWMCPFLKMNQNTHDSISIDLADHAPVGRILSIQ